MCGHEIGHQENDADSSSLLERSNRHALLDVGAVDLHENFQLEQFDLVPVVCFVLGECFAPLNTPIPPPTKYSPRKPLRV